MKNILLLFISILFIGCSEESSNNVEDNLLGTWKLIEQFEISGVHGNYVPVDDGYSYTFNNNGTFTSTRFNECVSGTYSVSDSKVYLNFGCEDFSPYYSDNGLIVENISFVNGRLHISPTYLSCDEGCGAFFEKQIIK